MLVKQVCNLHFMVNVVKRKQKNVNVCALKWIWVNQSYIDHDCPWSMLTQSNDVE